jgi:hypothetical protein
MDPRILRHLRASMRFLRMLAGFEHRPFRMLDLLVPNDLASVHVRSRRIAAATHAFRSDAPREPAGMRTPVCYPHTCHADRLVRR